MDVASNNEARIGLVNMGDINPTLNLDISSGNVEKPSVFRRLFESCKDALDPNWRTRERGEALLAAQEYERKMLEGYREMYPWMDGRRLFLLAHGYNMTEAQAENVSATMERVAELLDDAPKALPSPESADALVDAMSCAYDGEVRNLLARVLKGEFDAAGSVSRNALSIVKRMESADLKAFGHFCSLCSGGVDAETGFEVETVPCIVDEVREMGSTYRELPYSTVMHLDALGLVSRGSGAFFEREPAQICIGGQGYHAVRSGDGSKPLRMSSVALTPAGEELSAFFEKGTHPKLKEIVEESLRSQGFELKPHLKLVVVANLTTGEFAEGYPHDDI